RADVILQNLNLPADWITTSEGLGVERPSSEFIASAVIVEQEMTTGMWNCFTQHGGRCRATLLARCPKVEFGCCSLKVIFRT
ncbi:MAG: hypothetical protein M0008_08990, partial [Actinomycetota bacterium]|nr:hypothetical protein [Actinomycetota bacterium]